MQLSQLLRGVATALQANAQALRKPGRDGALKDAIGYVNEGRHTKPRKNARRKVKAEIGARQYRKQRKALARLAREQA